LRIPKPIPPQPGSSGDSSSQTVPKPAALHGCINLAGAGDPEGDRIRIVREGETDLRDDGGSWLRAKAWDDDDDGNWGWMDGFLPGFESG